MADNNENLLNYIRNNLPNAEVFKIQSLENKNVFEQDGQNCSFSTINKKDGLIVLFTNY